MQTSQIIGNLELTLQSSRGVQLFETVVEKSKNRETN
jgi:hypothetical protein